MQQLSLLRRKSTAKSDAAPGDTDGTQTTTSNLSAWTTSPASDSLHPDAEPAEPLEPTDPLEQLDTNLDSNVDSSVKSLSGALELADSFLASSSQEGLHVQSSGDCPPPADPAATTVTESAEPVALKREASRGSLLRRTCRTQGGLPSACSEAKPSAGLLELQEAATSILEEADFNATLPSCPQKRSEKAASEWKRDNAAMPGCTHAGRPEKSEKSEKTETSKAKPRKEAPAEAPAEEPPAEADPVAFHPVRRRVRCKSKAPRPTCVEDGACDPSSFCSQEDFEDFWIAELQKSLDDEEEEPGESLLRRRTPKNRLEASSGDAVTKTLKKDLSSFLAHAKARPGRGAKRISSQLEELATRRLPGTGEAGERTSKRARAFLLKKPVHRKS